eukprot:TRINITY_DN18019_c1_g1_i2.p1 TRINITY_DN18019_c1_g1~~TRINITY_DN18019_c1_g1_i2.p1  ORF type:complete len:191 (-),score=22.04 TRINITY_DN18019_c1_g1_i2:243-815(-)
MFRLYRFEKVATVCGMEIEVMDPLASNMYLGRALCLVNPHDTELEHRVKKTWSKFGAFKQELTDKTIPLHLRFKLFHTVVTPTILYGCCSWVMTNARSAKLRGMQLEMMRAILGRQRICGHNGEIETWVEWMQRVTDEARQLADKNNIPDWTNVQATRLRSWHTRLQQMDSERWAKQVFGWEPAGHRCRG